MFNEKKFKFDIERFSYRRYVCNRRGHIFIKRLSGTKNNRTGYDK